MAKRAVTPLMMAEKEKEPTPYLKRHRQIFALLLGPKQVGLTL